MNDKERRVIEAAVKADTMLRRDPPPGDGEAYQRHCAMVEDACHYLSRAVRAYLDTGGEPRKQAPERDTGGEPRKTIMCGTAGCGADVVLDPDNDSPCHKCGALHPSHSPEAVQEMIKRKQAPEPADKIHGPDDRYPIVAKEGSLFKFGCQCGHVFRVSAPTGRVTIYRETQDKPGPADSDSDREQVREACEKSHRLQMDEAIKKVSGEAAKVIRDKLEGLQLEVKPADRETQVPQFWQSAYIRNEPPREEENMDPAEKYKFVRDIAGRDGFKVDDETYRKVMDKDRCADSMTPEEYMELERAARDRECKTCGGKRMLGLDGKPWSENSPLGTVEKCPDCADSDSNGAGDEDPQKEMKELRAEANSMTDLEELREYYVCNTFNWGQSIKEAKSYRKKWRQAQQEADRLRSDDMKACKLLAGAIGEGYECGVVGHAEQAASYIEGLRGELDKQKSYVENVNRDAWKERKRAEQAERELEEAKQRNRDIYGTLDASMRAQEQAERERNGWKEHAEDNFTAMKDYHKRVEKAERELEEAREKFHHARGAHMDANTEVKAMYKAIGEVEKERDTFKSEHDEWVKLAEQYKRELDEARGELTATAEQLGNTTRVGRELLAERDAWKERWRRLREHIKANETLSHALPAMDRLENEGE